MRLYAYAGALLAVSLLAGCHSGGSAASGTSPSVTQSPNGASHAAASSAAAGAGNAKWTQPEPVSDSGYGINAVSCVKTIVACYAVDEHGDILESTAVNSWHVVDSVGGALDSISCVPGFCAAAADEGGVFTESNGTWTGPVTVSTDNSTLGAVSCASAHFCVAVDAFGVAYTYTGVPGQWTATYPAPVEPLRSVSCPSASFCAAVAKSGNAFVFDGTNWSLVGGLIDPSPFSQVSCSSATFCAAIDIGGNVAVMTGGHWALKSLSAPLTSVSCPTDGYCLVTDESGGLITDENGAWTRSKVGANALGAIGCPAPDACVAFDDEDNVLYYGR